MVSLYVNQGSAVLFFPARDVASTKFPPILLLTSAFVLDAIVVGCKYVKNVAGSPHVKYYRTGLLRK